MTAYVIAYSLILFFVAATVVAIACIYVRTQKAKLDERAASIDALSESEQTFINVFGNAANAAFVIIDVKTTAATYASPSVVKFFGLDAEKLSLDLTAIAHSVGKNAWRSFAHRYIEWTGEDVLSTEFEYGTDNHAIAQAVRIERSGKQYDAFLIYDVTEQTKEMKNLRTELDKALGEAAGKLSFLSSMSHEIRTPMNGVMGMMELARMNIKNPEKAGEYLARAGDLSVFLLSMINDILDISKLESGKMLLFNTTFDIFAFAEKIRNMFSGMVTGKGIDFNVETVDFTARYFVADEMRLTQVVTNFISNANKFTLAGGKIDVTFKQLDNIGGKAQILLRVRDTGKGIAPENIRKIMRPFEQEEASTAHHYGGTGLGLAICDQIVHLMGGNIVVDSVLGKGTDFSVFLSLPIADVEQDLSEPVKHVEKISGDDFSFEGCKILLAEDNEVNAEIAIEILSSEGAEITHAVDGQEALDIYNERPEYAFDLILLDVQMPRLNGRDTAKAIRDGGRADAQSVPIIALSADAFVEDIALSKAAGMDEHVSKPVDFDALRTTAGAVIAAKKATAAVKQTDTAPAEQANVQDVADSGVAKKANKATKKQSGKAAKKSGGKVSK
ncbi:MAG: response regulator [Clostridiales bacterium]|nr:response regulator [Clostridiales bacterium]